MIFSNVVSQLWFFFFFLFKVSRCIDVMVVFMFAGFDSERETSFSHCTV